MDGLTGVAHLVLHPSLDPLRFQLLAPWFAQLQMN